jgi:hypothetical protein
MGLTEEQFCLGDIISSNVMSYTGNADIFNDSYHILISYSNIAMKSVSSISCQYLLVFIINVTCDARTLCSYSSLF